MTLAGKRVLITGGGSRVGADLARGFVAAGAEAVICGRRTGPLRAVAGPLGARFVTADVTREDDIAHAFTQAGPCDIVIANAGAADSAPFGQVTLDQWNAMLAVNLTGGFLTFRAGLAQLPGWGWLIAVASNAGLRGYAYVAPYAAAKHVVVGLCRSLALEGAKRPVTVIALSPGYLDTDMTDRSVANIAAKTGMTVEAARAQLATINPQKRLVPPAEVTAAALWCAARGRTGSTGKRLPLQGARCERHATN